MENTPIKITINYNPDTSVEIQQWPLVKGNTPESNRISAEFQGVSYSLVLDKDNPRVEVWSLDGNKELKEITEHFSLPKARFVPE